MREEIAHFSVCHSVNSSREPGEARRVDLEID